MTVVGSAGTGGARARGTVCPGSRQNLFASRSVQKCSNRKVRAASTQWPAPESVRRAQARVSLSAAPALGAVEEPPPRIPDAAVGAPTTACPVGPATLRVVRWMVRIQKPRRSWRWRSKSRRSGVLPPPPVPPLLSPGRVPRQRPRSPQVSLLALRSPCGVPAGACGRTDVALLRARHRSRAARPYQRGGRAAAARAPRRCRRARRGGRNEESFVS